MNDLRYAAREGGGVWRERKASRPWLLGIGAANITLPRQDARSTGAAMKLLSICFAALVLAFTGASAADPAPVKATVGEAYSLPPWFKMSFLDFPAEVAQAREQGKHVMVFMHLDNCPYCARMLKDNFVSGDNRQFMEKHFDVIAVNVEGSLEVRWTDGRTYTEKALARHVKTVGTPTIVFLNANGDRVLQLTGYRDPREFRRALEYVQSKSYTGRPFAAHDLRPLGALVSGLTVAADRPPRRTTPLSR